MKKDCNTISNCMSWNCCDEQLKSCIEKSKFVNQTRAYLRKRRLENKLSRN